MQLGLDLPYPYPGLGEVRPRCASIHRRPPSIPVPQLRSRCLPSPCGRLSRPRTTTEAPPSSTPVAPPRLRRSHSTWPPNRSTFPGIRVASPQSRVRRAPQPGPYPPDLSRFHAYGASSTGSPVVTPLCRARRTRPVRWYQAVPPLSGLLAALLRIPEFRLPSTSTGRYDTRRWVLPPHPNRKRLVAHPEVMERARSSHGGGHGRQPDPPPEVDPRGEHETRTVGEGRKVTGKLLTHP